jgi:hypothetical protein
MDPVALKAFADEVSQKDFRWWFAIVFGILITGTTFIVKWLIAALHAQRNSNAEVQKEFISYMKDDRLKSAILLERVTMVLEKLEEDRRLEVSLGRRHNVTGANIMGTLPQNPSPSDRPTQNG